MKKIVIILCLTLLGTAFSGCNANSAYEPTGDALADYTRPTDEFQIEAPGTLEEQQEAFALAYYKEEGFNPFLCTNFHNRMLFSLLYQGLFALNSDYEAEPVLCKSFTVTEDLRVYTFRLESATFSDGTMLTAGDVVASYAYAEENGYFRGRFDNIAAYEALDERTVMVTAYVPYENLPMLLNIPIVKKDSLESDRPVGSGPYSIIDTASGLSLEKNNRWWCDAELPVKLEMIPLRDFPNPAGIRDGFEFENIGISTADPGAASYAEYRCDYELWEEETGIFLYLACNEESEVFSNDEVRKALTYAIDRTKILEENYNGFGVIATLPASPNTPFYHRGLASKVSFDSAYFEQVLKDQGMAGKEIILYVNKSDTTRLQAARQVAQMLSDCGLVVKLEDNSTVYYREGLISGEYDLYLGQTKLSPTMDLSEFFAPYGALSHGGMDDPATYAMCHDALENSGNYYNLHKLILEKGQLVPVLFRTYAVYGRRGLINDLSPSRENIFSYSLGKSIASVSSVDYGDE